MDTYTTSGKETALTLDDLRAAKRKLEEIGEVDYIDRAFAPSTEKALTVERELDAAGLKFPFRPSVEINPALPPDTLLIIHRSGKLTLVHGIGS